MFDQPTRSFKQRATEIDVMRDTCILTVDTAIVTRSIHLRVKLLRVILESIFHCVESDCPTASLDRLRVILARFTLQWIRSRITIGQLLSELATEPQTSLDLVESNENRVALILVC